MNYREECSARGGKQDGSCASGFGVCCTCNEDFTIYTYYLVNYVIWNINLIPVLASCGAQVNDNCSYMVQSSFSSLSLTSGITNPCTYTVCPVGNNICRIRYDFTVIMNRLQLTWCAMINIICTNLNLLDICHFWSSNWNCCCHWRNYKWYKLL